MFRYLPEQASTFAPEVDSLNHLITDISLFFTVAIVGAAIYFAIKYRRKNNQDHETPRIEGDHNLEIIWTVVPTIICIFIFVMGFTIHRDMRMPPADAMDIQVVGKKWGWNFEYPNGKKTVNEYVVPVDKPVRMVMRSLDVLHSFFVPAMRVKADLVPGRITNLWFHPTKTGTYRTYCTEYCGEQHSGMLATLKVVSQAEYDRWINVDSDKFWESRIGPADRGYALYKEQACVTCHSMDGSAKVGPSFKGIWGRKEKLADGTEIQVDEAYLQESILYPNKKIVAGYAPAMPAFEGILDDGQVSALIAFMKEVDRFAEDAASEVVEEVQVSDVDPATLTPEERGAGLYQSKICASCHSLDGSKLVGPSFKALYGKNGKLADGTEYVADDAYIKNSILNPNAQIVEGYAPAMPVLALTDDEISDLIAYMKTIK